MPDELEPVDYEARRNLLERSVASELWPCLRVDLRSRSF